VVASDFAHADTTRGHGAFGAFAHPTDVPERFDHLSLETI
jgi:hypothetical protein